MPTNSEEFAFHFRLPAQPSKRIGISASDSSSVSPARPLCDCAFRALSMRFPCDFHALSMRVLGSLHGFPLEDGHTLPSIAHNLRASRRLLNPFPFGARRHRRAPSPPSRPPLIRGNLFLSPTHPPALTSSPFSSGRSLDPVLIGPAWPNAPDRPRIDREPCASIFVVQASRRSPAASRCQSLSPGNF